MKTVTKPSGIKGLAPWDRPREKLHYLGAATLSDAELLAILIGSGTRGFSVVELCKRLLSSLDDDFQRLKDITVEELCKFKGIGEARAVMLLAVIEVAARLNAPSRPLVHLVDPGAVVELLRPVFRQTDERQYVLVLLNARQELLATCELTNGPGGLPDIAAMIRLATDAGAKHVVLACNDAYRDHKSFSKAEKSLSREFKAGAEMLGVKLDAFLLVRETGHYTFEMD